MLNILVSARGAVNRQDKFHRRRPGPVVARAGIHDTLYYEIATVPEGPMRDADFHLPQAFVGALLACMLLVAVLLANTAIAAPATGQQSTAAACPAPGTGC
jgi:hypothetical protein